MNSRITILVLALVALGALAFPAPVRADPETHPLQGSYAGVLNVFGAEFAMELRIDGHGKVKGKADWILNPGIEVKVEASLEDDGFGNLRLHLALPYHFENEWHDSIVTAYSSVTADATGLQLFDDFTFNYFLLPRVD